MNLAYYHSKLYDPTLIVSILINYIYSTIYLIYYYALFDSNSFLIIDIYPPESLTYYISPLTSLSHPLTSLSL
jgi:hypothetical protein